MLTMSSEKSQRENPLAGENMSESGILYSTKLGHSAAILNNNIKIICLRHSRARKGSKVGRRRLSKRISFKRSAPLLKAVDELKVKSFCGNVQ